uniref:Uncharacterized protein n=1 Tax=viral metagenome TaxID=1070528 RepID=A0A6C0DBQ2_9ZZZZ
MPITRSKIRNSIIASKIDIDYNDIDKTCKLITKQLSQSHLLPVINTTVYHMESLYRDNTNDKYYFSKQNNKNN